MDRATRKKEAKAAKLLKFSNKQHTQPTAKPKKKKVAVNSFESDIPKNYSSDGESKCYQGWLDDKLFHAQDGNKYVMLMPPPNVTGSLHIGHALTNTIEDIMMRWQKMHGQNTHWIPGTDHAGIATQIIVEKKLFDATGMTRHELGRDEFIKKVWEWKSTYGDKICDQTKKMGSAVDWSQSFFTLDDNFSRGVNEAFITCFDDGMITRSNRLVNWCCKLQSCISNIECEKIKVSGRTVIEIFGKQCVFGVLYSFAYKLIDSDEEIVVATTRPETIFGDTGIAVYPNDTKYLHLHGKYVQHPFLNRKIKIVPDAVLVDPSFGTGAVKVTPAHNVDDFECGRRHDLEFINIFNDDGALNANCGDFAGINRFDARLEVIVKLKQMGLYRSECDHEMVISTCSRSGDVIELVMRPQWWIDLAEPAKRAVEAVETGDLVITPAWKKKEWNKYLNKIEPWCISRQLWWGHRIPAYSCTFAGNSKWVAAHDIDSATNKAAAIFGCDVNDITVQQDEDVLDTWFSSALCPYILSDEIDVLETGYDILFFWVAKMVMMSLHLTDKLPFREILLHGMVRDSTGEKMSKSKGNVIDPLFVINGATLQELNDSVSSGNLSRDDINLAVEIQKKKFPHGIPKCGCDGLRYALCSYSHNCNDINFDINRALEGKYICNKVWNAFRLYMSISKKDSGVETSADVWITSKLHESLDAMEEAFRDRNFASMAKIVKTFWIDMFCDVYLEIIKLDGSSHQPVLKYVIETALQMTHPIMPFITENIWQCLGHDSSIFVSKYPLAGIIDQTMVDDFGVVCGIVHEIKSKINTKAARSKIVCTVYAKTTADLKDTIIALTGVHDIVYSDEKIDMQIRNI